MQARMEGAKLSLATAARAMDAAITAFTGNAMMISELARAVAIECDLSRARADRTYPSPDGENTVLGPECFIDKFREVISYQGENFYALTEDNVLRAIKAEGEVQPLKSLLDTLRSALSILTDKAEVSGAITRREGDEYRKLGAESPQAGMAATRIYDLVRERNQAGRQLRGLHDLVRSILQSLPDTADEPMWRDSAGALSVFDPDGQPYRAVTEEDL